MIFDRKVGSAFCRLAFPFRVQDGCNLRGEPKLQIDSAKGLIR
jgi:hypothetical protein